MVRRSKKLQDHPHACGDKSKRPNPSKIGCGSSPRVWGQDKRRHVACRNNRIIPTRVGTSESVKRSTFTLWDHPHACGDKESCSIDPSDDGGSSPRVWGQVCQGNYRAEVHRIIPTRVGTRLTKQNAATISRDHPHACGDKRQCNRSMIQR